MSSSALTPEFPVAPTIASTFTRRPTYSPYPTFSPYPYNPIRDYPDYPYPPYWLNRSTVLAIVIGGIVALLLCVLACIFGCVCLRRQQKTQSKMMAMSAASAGPHPQMLMVMPPSNSMTGPGNGLLPQFYTTSQRGPGGEELVLVPRQYLQPLNMTPQQPLQQQQQQAWHPPPPAPAPQPADGYEVPPHQQTQMHQIREASGAYLSDKPQPLTPQPSQQQPTQPNFIQAGDGSPSPSDKSEIQVLDVGPEDNRRP